MLLYEIFGFRRKAGDPAQPLIDKIGKSLHKWHGYLYRTLSGRGQEEKKMQYMMYAMEYSDLLQDAKKGKDVLDQLQNLADKVDVAIESM